jgi:hypothetical protein
MTILQDALKSGENLEIVKDAIGYPAKRDGVRQAGY